MRNTKRVVVAAAFALLFLFAFSKPAWAWGPGAHIECSIFLLKSLVLLPPLVRRVLRSHPAEFIYGALCPDMALGKRFVSPEKSNHRWSLGFELLQLSRTPGQAAFAMGFLSHLAADTVAHNLFIPDLLLERHRRGNGGHLSFEVLFDSMLDPEVWEVAAVLSRRNFPECEPLIIHSLPRTIFPRRVNRRLFKSSGLLVRQGGWQKVAERVKSRYGHLLPPEEMKPYLEGIHQTALDFLTDPEQADCLHQCPRGGEVLPRAEALRRELRRLGKAQTSDEKRDALRQSFRQWRENNLRASSPAAANARVSF